jgi:hypothetical protein
MKIVNKFLAVFATGLLLTACETEMVERIDEFGLEQGGYIRQVTPFPVTAFTVNLGNMAGSKMEFVAEAVTPEFGALFQSYDMVVRFVDATPANGTNNVADVALKSVPASAFVKDATTGYPRATISVTGKEAQDALKLTAAQIARGDRFEVRGTMKLTNGKSFTASNTSANITGGAFYSSTFFHRINIAD